MPLIEIVHQDVFSPRELTIISNFSRELPSLLTDDETADDLYLDPHTPADAVQVEVRQFSHRNINCPHLWVKMIFTEVLTRDQRAEALLLLGRMIHQKLVQPLCLANGMQFRITFDVFYGPGHGVMWSGDEVTTEW